MSKNDETELNEGERTLSNKQKSYGNFDESINANKKESNEEKERIPKCVFLIILNEFCERFSYYGIRTVLILYLTQFLGMNGNSASALFHAFTMLCYFMPLFGAILADGYIGQYATIVYVSVIYSIGELILCLTSMKPLGAPSLNGTIAGLLLISLGTGGIKPCVSAFGANQFSNTKQKSLITYFSLFYFSVNMGSFLGQLLTPILRSDIKCFGEDCYAVAFGVPTALMVISIILIVAGSPFYRIIKPNRNENIFGKLIGCISCAVKNNFLRNGRKSQEHWLNCAQDKYSLEFISDVKRLLAIAFLFLPLPVFWALFDQQGSRWTLQAQNLNTKIGNSFHLEADQIQSLNSILILIFIPLLNWIIYPLFNKAKILTSPFQRMVAGMILASLAFFSSAALENQIHKSFIQSNPTNVARFINLSPCDLIIDSKFIVNKESTISLSYSDIFANESSNTSFVQMQAYCIQNSSLFFNFNVSQKGINDNEIFYNYIFVMNRMKSKLNGYQLKSSIANQPVGMSEIRFYSFVNSISISVGNKNKNYNFNLDKIMLNNKLSDMLLMKNYSKYIKLEPDEYEIKIKNLKYASNISLNSGARYTYLIYGKNVNALSIFEIAELKGVQISFIYQFIQYVLITIGEALFVINGISFAYEQAPNSLKSVVQAMWYLNVAFGNLIVVIIAQLNLLKNQFYEYIFFASLMLLTSVIFAIMSHFYKGANYVINVKNNSPEITDIGEANSSNTELVQIETEKK